MAFWEYELNVPLPCTKYYKNSFSYGGAIYWSSLSYDVTEAESVGQLKSLL